MEPKSFWNSLQSSTSNPCAFPFIVAFKMKLALFILISLCKVSSRDHERTFKASKITKYENSIVLEDTSLSIVGLYSAVKCHLQCIYDKPCQSFFYRQSDGLCQLNAKTFSEDSNWQGSNGTKYYQITTDWCPPTNGYSYHKPTNICYKLSLSTKIWSAAREACQKDGGDLIVLETMEKYNHILDFIRFNGLAESNFIIGASDEKKEGDWYWVNDKELPLESTLWAEGEPNNQATGQEYALISSRYNLKLDDEYDWRESRYFCEIIQ